MKIGIDGRLWNESGVGRYIRNLTLGIDSKNLSDEYVIFLNKDSYGKVKFNNPKITKALSLSRWYTLSEQWKFKLEIEKQDVDLMHFTYFSYPVLYRRPFVITIHDLIIDHFPTGVSSSLPLPIYKIKHFGYKKITSSAVKNAQKIIAPSVATKNEIIDHYDAHPSKIEVVYEGFDPIIKGVNSVNLVSKNYILYVGNAYPHKNLDTLFRAFEKIRKKTNVDLVCIGRDDFFYKRLSKKLPEGVFILHDVDDSALFEYYTNARLFVMPSLMEGFGLPILEAMHLSCPVVCSQTPALEEIGGAACLYFDPNSFDNLAEALMLVLSDEKLAQSLVQKGKRQALKFSWSECVEKTLKIYESCDSLR